MTTILISVRRKDW